MPDPGRDSRRRSRRLRWRSDGEPAVRPEAASVARRGVVLAAGDIAYCGPTPDEETARLLAVASGDGPHPRRPRLEDGTPEEFERCYGPSWGRFKDRTRPAPGNHEYAVSDSAEGYFGYFGEVAHPPSGYYSFDLGGWHLIALNSELCNTEGCGPESEQLRWLQGDLADNRTRCTLAYWHHPRFSSGAEHGSDDVVAPLWDVLYQSGADVVLNGHDSTTTSASLRRTRTVNWTPAAASASSSSEPAAPPTTASPPCCRRVRHGRRHVRGVEAHARQRRVRVGGSW